MLVARFIPVFDKWYLCHAESYQNAFGSRVNGFKTRKEAVDFAEEHGFKVVKHDFDILQKEV